MKKKVLVLLLCLVVVMVFGGALNNKLKKVDTNLEFWIAENVDKVDFSQYQEKYGMWGGEQYYGKGYTPTKNEDGMQIDPEECVIYTVTNYPDYLSRKSHVTEISITDPNVTVYGLTINSSPDEIESVMARNGFRRKETENSARLIYVKRKFTVTFSNGYICMSVKVRNFLHVQF